MRNKPRILTAGLNPAWQKTLQFVHFKPFEVNRAVSVSTTASGKGINFVRACRIWDKADASVLQFAGGRNGTCLCETLDREGIRHHTVRIQGETRCCTTVLCGTEHTMTELIEPSARIEKEQVEELFSVFSDAAGDVGALAVCGTYPPGVPDDFYARLAAEAKKKGLFVFFDSFIGVEKALLAGIDLLKINRDELFALSGETQTEKAFQSCFRKFKIGAIAVTDGKNTAFLSEGGAIGEFNVPVIEKVISPLGSGDTCSGIMLSEILSGTNCADAFLAGLAAASANCLNASPASFDPALARSFIEQTKRS